MFYDRSGYGNGEKNSSGDDFWLDGESDEELGSEAYYDRENLSDRVRETSAQASGTYVAPDPGLGYDLDVIASVWEFAEAVPGNDAALWRKDEFGDWIYRFDYGKKSAEFGWEIFDPSIGRHNQGVYAMRPMQSQNFLQQYS